MTDTVVDIEAYRPHVVVYVDDESTNITTAHVIPVVLLEHIVTGKAPVHTLPPTVWRKFLDEWLLLSRNK